MTIPNVSNDLSSSYFKSFNSRDYNYSSRSNDMINNIELLHTIWLDWSKYKRSIYKHLNINNTEELISIIKNKRIKYEDFLTILHKLVDKKVCINTSHNIIITSIFDERYPTSLLNIQNITESIYPPLLLYTLTNYNIDINDSNKIISIVGTRKCSDEGKEIAYDIGKILSKKYIVATGLAKGIDYYANKGALDNDGNVIAVRPYLCPIDYVNNKDLELIINNGIIISENLNKINSYEWIAKQLYLRNRIISSIAKTVIIIEARNEQHSGTMHQIQFALKRGKPVFIWKPKSNEFMNAYEYYIKQGAKGFSSIDELISMID